MMSATGVAERVRSRVSTPVSIAAGATPAHPKSSGSAAATKGVVPWNQTRKLCTPLPGAIVAGVFGMPVSALVAGLVVW